MELSEATEAIRDGRARAFRIVCGLSLADAGREVGVGALTVWRWEHGKRHPHPGIALAYVSALLTRMAKDAS